MSDAVKFDSLFFVGARMTELPFDMLVEIACESVSSWRAMLAVPPFARWTVTEAGRRRAASRFVGTTRIEGMECTTLNDRTHSFWGQPAAVRSDGWKEWRRAGRKHRTGGPAIVGSDGYEAWYRNGQRHRDDGPAVITSEGYEAWYFNDKLHRDDGPAVVWSDGQQEWYRDDQRHRDDGPAVIYADGRQEWYRDGVPYDPNV